MQIIITTDPGSVSLHQPDDFTAFSVAAPPGSADVLDAQLGTLGQREGEHVWVDRDALADLAGDRGQDPQWRDGLARMVEYARTHGFLSDDGTAIRAHIERVGPQAG